jgi:8-oxo-dGTP diphosphatase
VTVLPRERVPGEWALPSGHVLHVWTASLVRGTPRALQDHDLLRWVTPDESLTLDWLPPDLPAVGWIRGRL